MCAAEETDEARALASTSLSLLPPKRMTVRTQSGIGARPRRLLAPFAAAAAYSRTAGITPDDAVVESLGRAEQLDLKAELDDMMKTHVSWLL